MTIRTSAALGVASVLLCMSAAQAADPNGTWLTEDKDAIIRVTDCAGGVSGAPPATPSGKLCGFIAWFQDPDQAAKDGYAIGRKVVLDMVPAAANKWDGQVLNTDDGKMYKGNLELAVDGTLKVSGCLLFVCRSQTWIRRDLPVQTGHAAPAPAPGQSASGAAQASQPPRAR